MTENQRESDFDSLEDPGNYWLRQYLLEKHPALGDPEAADWDKVNLLRQWACRNSAGGAEPCQLHWTVYRNEATSAARLFQIFKEDEGGVRCAGRSHLFIKLLQVFGFRAWRYSMGCGDLGINHSLNIAEISVEGTATFIFQDCDYNHAFTDMMGQPLCIRSMLDLLRQRRHDEIQVVKNSYTRDCHYPIAKMKRFAADKRMESKRLGYFKVASFKDADVWDDTCQVSSLMECLGHPRHWLYIFLYPTSHGQETLQAIAPDILKILAPLQKGLTKLRESQVC